MRETRYLVQKLLSRAVKVPVQRHLGRTGVSPLAWAGPAAAPSLYLCGGTFPCARTAGPFPGHGGLLCHPCTIHTHAPLGRAHGELGRMQWGGETALLPEQDGLQRGRLLGADGSPAPLGAAGSSRAWQERADPMCQRKHLARASCAGSLLLNQLFTLFPSCAIDGRGIVTRWRGLEGPRWHV